MHDYIIRGIKMKSIELRHIKKFKSLNFHILSTILHIKALLITTKSTDQERKKGVYQQQKIGKKKAIEV